MLTKSEKKRLLDKLDVYTAAVAEEAAAMVLPGADHDEAREDLDKAEADIMKLINEELS